MKDFSPVRKNSEATHFKQVDCNLKTVLPKLANLISEGRLTNWLQNDKQ